MSSLQSQVNSIPGVFCLVDWLGFLVFFGFWFLGFFDYLFFFLKFIYLFIYLFLAALGLHCCAQAFSSCGEQGLLFIAVHGLLIAVAALVADHGL